MTELPVDSEGITEEQLQDIVLQMEADPIAFHTFNPISLRFFKAVPENYITISTSANGTDKTHSLWVVISVICFGTANPIFSNQMFQHWPYEKSLRVVCPGTLAQDGGAIQEIIPKVFPKDRYTMSKGVQKHYSKIVTDTGFNIDILTFGQPLEEHAGSTKGLVCFTETLPANLWGEMVGRTRAGGIIVGEVTPCSEDVSWLEEVLSEGSIKGEDGKEVGRICRIQGHIEENCKEHSPGGRLSHNQIQRLISTWPESERESRKTGSFLGGAGKVLPTFTDKNVVTEIPEHLKQWYKDKDYTLALIVDPHDRKPFALGWWAIFPNDDRVCLDEWPNEGYQPFHKILNCSLLSRDYVDLMVKKEKELGRKPDIYLMDPNFGKTPCFSSNMTITEELIAEFKKRDRQVYFKFPKDDIAHGNLVLKNLLGNDNVRNKLYVLKKCFNHAYHLMNVSYKKDLTISSLSERIIDKCKDFYDVTRYMAVASKYSKKYSGPPIQGWKPKERGSNYKGA